MKHESELTAAMRNFAMADPEDCDREWGAYLALVKEKGSASASSPTSSTSPLHYRARASTAAVTDPSATHSTAPLRAPSDLSPGARRIYDYLTGATDNFHEPAAAISSPISALAVSRARPGEEKSLTRSASTTRPASTASLHAPSSSAKDGLTPAARRIYDYLVAGSAAPTSTTTRRVPSSAVPTSGILEPAAAKPTPRMDHHTVAPSTCSKLGPDNITGVEDHLDVPQDSCRAPLSLTSPLKDSPSPPCASVDGFDLVFVSPTSCSRKCLEDDMSLTPTLSSPAAVSTSSAFTAAPPATVLATPTDPAAGDLLKRGDDVTSPAPNYVAAVVPVTTIKVMTTTLCLVKPSTEHKLIGVESLHTPWTPPRYVTFRNGNRRKDLPEVLHFDGFVIDSTQLMLWVAKSPWPPPQSYRSTSWRIVNLHATLDNMQLLGDWQVLKTGELKLFTALLVIIFAPGVQCTQLQPTMFKCILVEIEIKSLAIRFIFVLHLHWDPGGFSRHQFGVKSNFREIAWLLVGSYWANSESGRTGIATLGGLRFWKYPRPLVKQMMLDVYHSFSAGDPIEVGLLIVALVQWKTPCKISRVLVQFEFQYCSAGRESLHGCEKFQWTIAWFLSYHSSLSSLQTRSACVFLLGKQNCPAIYEEPGSRVIRMALAEPCAFCDVPDFGYKWLILWSTTESKVMILQILYRLSEMSIDFSPEGLTSWNYEMLREDKELLHGCSSFFVWHPVKLERMLAPLLQVLISSCLPSTNVRWDCEVMDWKLPWIFHYLLLENCFQGIPTGIVGNKYKRPFLAAAMDLNFHLEHSWLVCHPETTTCLLLRPPARCYLEMNSEFGRGKFSWDPGIQALLCSCGFFAATAAKIGFIVEAPT